MNRKASFWLAFIPLCLLLAIVVQAQTYEDHSFPYRGHIEENGVPVDGTVDLEFGIYNDPAAGACGMAPTAECLWGDTVAAVNVSNGSFSVVLGDGQPLSDQVWEADAVYIGIAVRRTGEPAFVPLAGRQRVLPVPTAARGHSAVLMYIRDALGIGGVSTEASLYVEGPDDAPGQTPVRVTSPAGSIDIDGDSVDANGSLDLNANGGTIEMRPAGAVRATVSNAGLALNNQKLTGLATGTAAGDAVNVGQFGAVLNANSGYQRLPSGLIMQWRRVNESGATGDQNIGLPTPFPNAALHAQVSWRGQLNSGAYRVDVNQNNWVLRITAGHSPTSVFLFAIGY